MIFNVIVETPRGSRNKYEMDKKSGRIMLDRVLHSSVHYPADYGYIPDTLYSDGDPLDVLILNRFSVIPGCIVHARPIAVFKMIDSGDNDEKIIAVSEKDPHYRHWQDINDIPESLRDEIEEFFKTYKNLERGKYVEVKGWGDAKEAEEIVNSSFKKD